MALDYDNIIDTYVNNNDVSSLQTMFENNKIFDQICLRNNFDYACKHGKIECIEWFVREHKDKCNNESGLYKACENKQYDAILWFLNNNSIPCDTMEKAFHKACISGDMKCIELLKRNKYVVVPQKILLAINENKHYDVLIWLNKASIYNDLTINNYIIIKNICKMKDNLEDFEWLTINCKHYFPKYIDESNKQLMHCCFNSGIHSKIRFITNLHEYTLEPHEIFEAVCISNYEDISAFHDGINYTIDMNLANRAHENEIITTEQLLCGFICEYRYDLITPYIDEQSYDAIARLIKTSIIHGYYSFVDWINNHRQMTKFYNLILEGCIMTDNLNLFKKYSDKMNLTPCILNVMIQQQISFLTLMHEVGTSICNVFQIFEFACEYEYFNIMNWMCNVNPKFVISVDNERLIYGEVKGMIVFEPFTDKDNIIPNEECEICFTSIKNCITECNHTFCKNCITSNLAHNMTLYPMCKQKIVAVRIKNEP